MNNKIKSEATELPHLEEQRGVIWGLTLRILKTQEPPGFHEELHYPQTVAHLVTPRCDFYLHIKLFLAF